MTPDVDHILAALRTFGERHLNSMRADARRSLGPDVLMDLAELGLFGLQVPRAEGGLALSHRQTARISIQLGALDMSLAVMIGMHNGLGLGPILAAALPDTRAALVPVLASDRGLAAYALTEIGPGGSNPRGLRTIASAVPGGHVLRGHKVWIGLAPWARVITVLANAVDESGAALGTLACLVRRGNPGLRIGEQLQTMGTRAVPKSHLHLEDAFIPAEDVLGAPGEGMAIAQRVMQAVRLGIAAMCAGAMQRCAQLAVRYATHRTVASGPLLESAV